MDPPVGVGIQLHCGQYLTLERPEHERGFSPGCASVLGKALPLPAPALCYLKHDTEEGWRKARERFEQIFTPTTSVVVKVVLFTLLASLLLLIA